MNGISQREAVARAIYAVTVRWVQGNFPEDHELRTFDELDERERRLNLDYADAALGVQPSAWLPIETAPTDGTTFDGWGYAIPDCAEMPMGLQFARHTECYWGKRDSEYVRRRIGKQGWCSRGHDGWSWAMVLTHWMPVPDAPSAQPITQTSLTPSSQGPSQPPGA